MAIIDDFKARFPQFDPAEVDQLLPSLIAVYPCYYGKPYVNCYQEATLQLLAHLFVINSNAQNGSSSPIRSESSKTVKNVSVSYEASGATSQSDVFFQSTLYGQTFLMLTAPCQGGFFV